MELNSAQLKEKSLVALLQLVDFSIDLDRNRDDTMWSDDGKQIVYLYDTSVFDCFLEPKENKKSMRPLRWAGSLVDDKKQDFSSQAAMLAAEYLIGSGPPGVLGREMLLTPWHYEELISWIEKRHTSLSLLLKRKSQSVVDEISQRLELVERIKRDYKTPKKRTNLTLKAASVLANSVIAEPLDQISRLLNPKIFDRILPATSKYVPDQEELALIEISAREWFKLILDDVNHKKKVSKKEFKGPNSIWNDARSIAYSNWLSTKLRNDGKRVVFVSADNGLYQVYREWYANQDATSINYYDPFIMRRLSQYAPQLNLVDASSDLSSEFSDRSEAFELYSKVRDAVELALMPFYLISETDRNNYWSDREVFQRKIRGKEFLAIGLSHDSKIIKNSFVDRRGEYFSSEWYKARLDEITELRGVWETFQELGVSLFFELVSNRLKEDFGIVYEDVQAMEKIAGQKLTVDKIIELVDDLALNGQKSAVNGALDFIDSVVLISKPLRNRLPNTIWYNFSKSTDVSKLVNKWFSTGKKSSKLFESVRHFSVEDLFAFASIIALNNGHWAAAQRYAKLALEASSGAKAQTDELKFLLAVCRRFYLGTITTIPLSRPKEVTSRIHELVIDTYLEALTLHNEILQNTSSNSKRNNILKLRAQSEVSALNLLLYSHVALFDFPIEIFGSLEPQHLDIEEIKLELLDIFHEVKKVEEGHRVQEIQRQITYNIAAAESLKFLASPKDKYKFDKRLVEVCSLLHTLYNEKVENESAMIRAEVLCFLGLGKKHLGNHIEKLNEAIAQGERATLFIDRQFCKSLHLRMSELRTYFRQPV